MQYSDQPQGFGLGNTGVCLGNTGIGLGNTAQLGNPRNPAFQNLQWWYRYPVVAGPSGRLAAEFAGAWEAAMAAVIFPFPPSRLNPGIVRATTRQ